ncbi:DNA-processing protein DprA [Pontivivens ytuae]|uniref:DNA-protecting protein DprA n=1 Tax=Pontivivens ytuae TaxID=2789856 RepID=A0A7S9LVE5_9RHOB|nr:DNA-processing protein DprA [Pontivivens ytuae]QPH55974.1 DNA-protecting protein DprA [Pontivivens ytuae]
MSRLSSDQVEAHLALARSPRVGPVTFRRLIETYGDAVCALEALPQHAARGGMRSYRPAPMDRVREELARGQDSGARLLVMGGHGYPERLMELNDGPLVLWARGDVALVERPVTALVGARNASALGLRMARQLALDLGAVGHVVASGLARGIDTAAHTASLETGTVAVMAGGIDVIYPASNQELARQIADTGLLLSEAPPGLQPMARHFPKRNRIIAGLATTVVLVEAAERSGSLITARMALEQGREVMAVPGHPLDARAAGCNRLIREGAGLVRSAEDVLDALALPVRPVTGFHEDTGEWLGDRPLPDETRQMLVGLISPAPVAEDELIRNLGVPAGQVLAALMDMELAGQIERHPGGLVARRIA